MVLAQPDEDFLRQILDIARERREAAHCGDDQSAIAANKALPGHRIAVQQRVREGT